MVEFLPKYKQVFEMIDTIMENVIVNWIFYTTYFENNLFVHILVSDKGDLIHVSKNLTRDLDFVADFVKRRYDFEGIKLCVDRDLYIARKIHKVSKSEITSNIDKRILELYEANK